MTTVRRRYTTVDGKGDWIVAAAYDETRLDTTQWFEAAITATNEKSNKKYPFPPEIATYRIGEIEHRFREFVALDYNGDQEAAINHLMDTIFRRVYAFIERGH